MAAPVYATDLSNIYTDGDTTGWTGLGGGASGLQQESDYYLEGSYCMSKDAWAAAIKGMIYNHGSGVTIPADGAAFTWITHQTPNSLNTIAGGGIQFLVGSGSGDYKHFYVGGSDTIPFMGWIFAAVDPSKTGDQADTGSPTATRQYFGGLADLPTGGPSKGAPFALDAIRYGRGELRCINGEAANYATFSGANIYGDDSTRRWGLLSLKDGAYYMSGLFLFGLAATSVDFRDSDKSIFIRDHPHVTAAFNTLEVRHASSNVELTNIVFQALGSTSKGRWLSTANATILLTGCTFINMNTFGFESNADVLVCKFLRCGAITVNTAMMTGSAVEESAVAADTSALIWNVATDPDGYLDGMIFSKGTNAHHAIELGTSSPLTMTFRGLTSDGFNAADAQNDSFFHVKRTSGDVTINIIGGTGNFKYKSAGANVTIVLEPVTTQITVKGPGDINIQGVQVLVEASDNTGDLPFETLVSITRVGAVASVSHTGHGLANGAKVVIRGANQQEYNKIATISNVSTNAYDYAVSGTPATPATGTIISSGVAVAGSTNASGIVSSSRSFSVNQNVKGVARKTSSSPYYHMADFTDIVDKSNGLTKTIQLVLDE